MDAKDYKPKKDSESEVTGFELRSQGEKDFAGLHKVKITTDPHSMSHQHRGHGPKSVKGDEHNSGAGGDKAPLKLKNFKQVVHGFGKSSKRHADKSNPDGVKEEIELDELSKSTLTAYKHGAKSDIIRKAKALGWSKDGTREKEWKKIDKRMAGVKSADERLTFPNRKPNQMNDAQKHLKNMRKEEIELDEKLGKDASAKSWIRDFVKSKDSRFSGDDKKQRIKRALGAYYAKQNEEAEAVTADLTEEDISQMDVKELRKLLKFLESSKADKQDIFLVKNALKKKGIHESWHGEHEDKLRDKKIQRRKEIMAKMLKKSKDDALKRKVGLSPQSVKEASPSSDEVREKTRRQYLEKLKQRQANLDRKKKLDSQRRFGDK